MSIKVGKIKKQKKYVAKMGQFFSSFGLTYITGQFLGYILSSDNPLSSKELEKLVEVSKSTASTTLKTLISTGFIQKTRIPGERSDYYTIVPSLFTSGVKVKTKAIVDFKQYIIEAIHLTNNQEKKKQLVEIYEMYDFFELEFEHLIGKWDKIKEERISSSILLKE